MISVCMGIMTHDTLATIMMVSLYRDSVIIDMLEETIHRHVCVIEEEKIPLKRQKTGIS